MQHALSRVPRIEHRIPSAMTASNYRRLCLEVLLLDKHTCLAQSYMLDIEGHGD